MSQSGYGAMLGSSSSPLPQASGFNSLHQHERMVICPYVSPRVRVGRLGARLSDSVSPHPSLGQLPTGATFGDTSHPSPLSGRTTSCTQER